MASLLKDKETSTLMSNPFTHRMNIFCASRKRVAMLLIVLLIILSLLTAGRILPLMHNEGKVIVALNTRTKQAFEAKEKLQKEINEQQIKLQEIKERSTKIMSGAISAGGYTEKDVAYWRKQMEAFGLMTGMKITIIGRSISKFAQAMTIKVELLPANGGALTPQQTARALDFLQLYGYLESFDGKTAIVHISNFQKGKLK